MNAYIIADANTRRRTINLDLIVKIELGEWENADKVKEYYINFHPIVGNVIQAKFHNKQEREDAYWKAVNQCGK